jgi:hypothetical protein
MPLVLGLRERVEPIPQSDAADVRRGVEIRDDPTRVKSGGVVLDHHPAVMYEQLNAAAAVETPGDEILDGASLYPDEGKASDDEQGERVAEESKRFHWVWETVAVRVSLSAWKRASRVVNQVHRWFPHEPVFGRDLDLPKRRDGEGQLDFDRLADWPPQVVRTAVRRLRQTERGGRHGLRVGADRHRLRDLEREPKGRLPLLRTRGLRRRRRLRRRLERVGNGTGSARGALARRHHR